jgi:predicted RNA-binding Zn-ribbon protein involved in translation (DUF1610 family)
MARRNRTSVFEDIIHLIAKLPWWAGLLIALISYLWLHNVASQPVPTPTPGIQHMGDMVVSQMWHTLAIFLQYIIPICSLIGAGVSAYFKITNKASFKATKDTPPRKTYSQKSAVDNSSKTQSTPECPQCGSVMVKRTAKKGSNAGESFWGCTGYPKCKGTRTSV